LETFSRGQQAVVLLLIFGLTLIYFHSIQQPENQQVVRTVAANERRAQPIPPSQSKSQLPSKNISGPKLLTINRQINLNTATANDLVAIRGIGPKTAERIIEHRQRYGIFKKVEDIMKVPGIKEKKFEKVKMFLTVR